MLVFCLGLNLPNPGSSLPSGHRTKNRLEEAGRGLGGAGQGRAGPIEKSVPAPTGAEEKQQGVAMVARDFPPPKKEDLGPPG